MKKPTPILVPLWLRLFLWSGVLVASAITFLWFGYPSRTDHLFPEAKRQLGITWSAPYAESLGISSNEGLQAAINDLGVQHVRLPVYWSRVEQISDIYDWTELDAQLDLLTDHSVPVTLAIGLKVPRWPECWIPDWAETLPAVEREQALWRYLRNVVIHTRSRKIITAWQIENEPFFPFGICPKRTIKDVAREAALVRALDPLEAGRKILTTDSGEVGFWQKTSPVIDEVGISVYRVTNATFLGMRTYDWLPPWWYARKTMLTRLLPGGAPTYISEFQMEPWVLKDLRTLPIPEMLETFPLTRMQNNHWFLDRSRFLQADLWGVEWWYWMKTQKGHPEFWEEAKQIFQKT